VTAAARRALKIIQECLAADRFVVLPHFAKRLDQRGLFWPDIEAVIDSPQDVQRGGKDRWDRSQWILRGKAADGLDLSIVCAIDHDEPGHATVFITIYWRD